MQYTVGNPASIASYLRGRKSRARKGMVANLMLTPMVDMFSLLVIFLLQFFNASPDFQLTNGIVLPTSLSSETLKEVPVISVSKEEVTLDRRPIGTMAEVLKKPAALVAELEALQQRWVAEHPGEQFLGEINFEADQDLESTVVSQYMAILAAQHFGSIQLIALGE